MVYVKFSTKCFSPETELPVQKCAILEHFVIKSNDGIVFHSLRVVEDTNYTAPCYETARDAIARKCHYRAGRVFVESRIAFYEPFNNAPLLCSLVACNIN